MRGAREGGQCERPSDRTSDGEVEKVEEEEEDHTPFAGTVLLYRAISRCAEMYAFACYFKVTCKIRKFSAVVE